MAKPPTIDERLALLEGGNSFVAAATAAALVVSSGWSTIVGLNVGPQNFPRKKPDVAVAPNGAGLIVNRPGRYFMALNSQFVSATADGYFEPAVQPVGICTPLWPNATNVGHDGCWVPAAMFAYAGITPGKAIMHEAPCLQGDVITGSAKFSSASGTATISVRSIMYAIWVGPVA